MKTKAQQLIEDAQYVKYEIKKIMQKTTRKYEQTFAERRKHGGDLSPDEHGRIYESAAREVFDLVTTFQTQHN
jgi:hypothetical protein